MHRHDWAALRINVQAQCLTYWYLERRAARLAKADPWIDIELLSHDKEANV